MKTLSYQFIPAAVAFALMLTCCRKAEDTREPGETDLETLEQMEVAYKRAYQYNDSLHRCLNQGDTCQPGYLLHCDSMFHFFLQRWEYHHGEYSHNTSGDDHHHSGGMTNHHNRRNGHEHRQGHSLYQHDLVSELMTDHEPLHPVP